MHCSFFKSTLVLNSGLLYWKLLGHPVSALCIRYFALFNVRSLSKNSPSAKCTSTADVYRDVDDFGTQTVFLNDVI
jgi:hypothetical protein